MEISQLEKFRNPECKKSSILQVWETVEWVLLRVKQILETRKIQNSEIQKMMKDILIRAYIIDKIFNPLHPQEYDLYCWEDVFVRSDIFSLLWQTQDEAHEENELYHHTPSIWVFFNGIPVFLNHNYIEALWAENEAILKEDIINNIALEKYYTPESAKLAREALERLTNGEWYKDLILETKIGKKISWNSFGSTDGLEIRIGNDISHWEFKNTQTNGLIEYEWTELNTMNCVQNFIWQVEHILKGNIDTQDKNILILFSILWSIVDRIWNDGQFLMNITSNNDIEEPMIFNSKYAKALKRTKEEIEKKAKDGTLWPETYDYYTNELIQWLMKVLEEEWYYISDFPMKDSVGNTKNLSWWRFQLKKIKFWIDITVWIWNASISKVNAELEKYYSNTK